LRLFDDRRALRVRVNVRRPAVAQATRPQRETNTAETPEGGESAKLMAWSAAFKPAGGWVYKRRTEEIAMGLFTLGIDLGKKTFHLVGMNQRGVVLAVL
jgi:hypothetical protein